MVQPGDEDISPYATFHLLGMREENKNAMMNPQAYKTMPHPPGAGKCRADPNSLDPDPKLDLILLRIKDRWRKP